MNKIPVFTQPLPKCVGGLEFTSTAATIYINQTANSQFCLNLPICHSQREDQYKSLMLQRTHLKRTNLRLIENILTHKTRIHSVHAFQCTVWSKMRSHIITCNDTTWFFHHHLTDATHWQFIHIQQHQKYFPVSGRRLHFHVENDASVNDAPVYVPLDASTCEGKTSSSV